MSDQPLATFHDLKGRSVFITGGGAGIGASLTEGFLAQGAKVAFVQRSNCDEFVAEMAAKYDQTPLFLQCDVTDLSALETAMEKAADAHGPITVLVNNAANDTRHTTEELTEQGWADALDVNLRPHFFTAKFAAPGMKAAGGGAIINYSSISYMMGLGEMTAYVTSKAAITGLTRGHAREFGPDNIRVNAIMPGWVLTERQLKLWATKEGLASHLETQCLQEHLSGPDLVGPTLFLASNASRMITGQAIVVDGGVVFSG